MGKLWLSAGISTGKEQPASAVLSDQYIAVLSTVCELYRGERGKQRLPESCPGYCEQYAYIYPEHLHMAGRYNSLFGLDEELVKHPEQLKAYQQAGIDRLVIGL